MRYKNKFCRLVQWSCYNIVRMSDVAYQDVVNQIKSRLDIVEVVQSKVILKKQGANYWGCCPFHKEKTPSFSVNPAKGIYKCFGCGEGGDVLTFMLKTSGQTFSELIKDQAEIFGIELPKTYAGSKEATSKKQKALEVIDLAAQFYTQNLFESDEAKFALEYLKKRGLDDELIKRYRLGYSPNSTDKLQEKLGAKFDKSVLEDAGLIIKRDNQVGYIDRFRNRIMIPIFDERGFVVAFGARALSDGQNPKYLNSPDTIIYNKSKVLYGLYEAKEAISRDDFVIIMEGYFDVISTQAHGLKNCVASCGTSLTHEHIKLISKYSKSRRIYLAFDSDLAGIKATQRGAELIKEAFSGLGNIKQFDEIQSSNSDKYSCEIRVITPLDGKDPDEYIQEQGIEKYKEYLESAPLLIDFQLDLILKDKKSDMSPSEKLKMVKSLAPIVNEIDNDIVKDEYIKLISTQLQINETALKKEFVISRTNDTYSRNNFQEKLQIVKKNSNLAEKAQKILLSLYLVNEDTGNWQKLNELIKDVKFDNEKLIIVKTTIDKLLFRVNNVLELTQALYTQFASDDELKNIITELTDLAQSFQSSSLDVVVKEQIIKLEGYNFSGLTKQLQAEYKQPDLDEKSDKEYQMQLAEKLKAKSRLITGENE